jgi:chromosome segregation ATPase
LKKNDEGLGGEMEREQWKEVLSTLSDEELVEMIGVWNLKVKGFRSINRDNIKVSRKMAIAEALKFKNLKRIKSFYNMFGESDIGKEDETEKSIRDYTLNELMDSYSNGKELHILLGVLFSSEEEKHHIAAKSFIEELLNENNVQSLENLILKGNSDEETNVQSNSVTNDLEGRIEKIQLKNQKLQKQINDWEQQYINLKKEYKEEKQSWIKEKAQLQQEIGNEKSSLEKQIKGLEPIKQKNRKLQEEINELKAEKAHLHAQLLNSHKEVAVTVSEKNEYESKAITQVLMIGDPKNKIIESTNNPKLSVLDPKKAVEKIDSFEFNEIWILEYLVSPPVKRKIMKKYKDKVRRFKDFTTVRNYLEKGRI